MCSNLKTHVYRKERKLIKKVDKVITVNNSLAVYFEKKYSIKKPNIVRSIPEPTKQDEPVLDLRKKNNWVSENDIILIYQGVLNPGRGIDYMFELISALPQKYKLIIIGMGPMANYVKQQIEVKKNNRIYFHGEVENRKLAAYTAQADIGLCLIEPNNLSKKLALPNKIFEYLHSEIPILGSDLPEIKHIIEKYNIGKITTFNTDDMIAALRDIENSDYALNLLKAKKDLNWESEKKTLKKLITI